MKELNSQAHWEIARGSNKEASDYCKKDGKFHEFGELPEEPHKLGNEVQSAKWREISDLAKKGDLATIDEKYPKPFISCYKNLKSIKTDYMVRKPDLDNVCGTWYYGKPGVGKTRLVTKLYPNAYLKRMNKWFDGYQHEEVIVVDDLDMSHAFMGYELKKLADRYCYMVEVKNDSMYIRPKQVIVTSQFSIDEIWKLDEQTAIALKRRFKQIEVTSNNIAMLLSQQPVQEMIDVIEDDNEALLFDQLMVEVEAERLRKSTLAGDKLKKLNEYIASKRIDIDKLPKKLQPTNKYFPDKRLQWKTPVTKPVMNPKLERKNAMRTPPIPKPTLVPPPAPKKQKYKPKIVDLDDYPSSDDEKNEEEEDDENLIAPKNRWVDDEYEPPTLHDLYADEILDDSENNSIDSELEIDSDEY